MTTKPRPGIECPRCGHGTHVVQTNNLQTWIKRMRLCSACGHAFQTKEVILHQARDEHTR